MQDVEDLQKLLLQKHDAGMQKYKKKKQRVTANQVLSVSSHFINITQTAE